MYEFSFQNPTHIEFSPVQKLNVLNAAIDNTTQNAIDWWMSEIYTRDAIAQMFELAK